MMKHQSITVIPAQAEIHPDTCTGLDMDSRLRVNDSEKGNALFLILIAVALFAALSYAITQSSRGGGGIDREQAELAASDITNYYASLTSAVLRMQITGSFKPEEISFVYEKPFYDGSIDVDAYDNTNCTQDACRVFNTTGGGISARVFSSYAVPHPTNWQAIYAKPGALDFLLLEWPGAGTSANDVAAFINAVRPEICDVINRRFNLPSDVVISGLYVSAHIVSNWDATAKTVSASEGLSGSSIMTYTKGSGSGRHCHVYQLLFAR